MRRFIYGIIFLSSFFQGIMSLYSLYLSDCKIGINRISIHYSVMGLAGIIGSASGGFLGEHLGIKRTSLLMNFLLIAAISFILLHGNLYVFSFVIALGIVVNKTSVLNYFSMLRSSEAMETFLSWRRLLLNLGVASGAWIAGIVLDISADWFIYYCLLVLLATLIFLLIMSYDNVTNIKIRETRERSLSFLFLNCFIFIIALAPFSLLSNYYVIYIKHIMGISQKEIGYIYLISGLVIIFLQIPITKLLRHLGTGAKCLIGSLFIGIGISLVGISSRAFHIYLEVVLWSVGEIILFVPFLQYFLGKTHYSRGVTIGIYHLCFSLSEMTYPFLSAKIILKYGYQVLWLCVLSISIISAILFSQFIKK